MDIIEEEVTLMGRNSILGQMIYKKLSPSTRLFSPKGRQEIGLRLSEDPGLGLVSKVWENSNEEGERDRV